MDDRKRNLKGSETRDEFKRRHKELNKDFWATDADFCLVSKSPPGTVAYLDYKTSNDSVTFTETIQYNEWCQHTPVYIVEGDDPTNGPFRIRRYLGGNWRPNPTKVDYGDTVYIADWEAFEKWERELREEYTRRNGWNKLTYNKDIMNGKHNQPS